MEYESIVVNMFQFDAATACESSPFPSFLCVSVFVFSMHVCVFVYVCVCLMQL